MPNIKLFELPYSTTGKTTIYGIIMQRSTGYFLDDSSGAFTQAPADKYVAAVEHAVLKGLYQISEARLAWTDDSYICVWYDQVGGAPDPNADSFLGTTTMRVASDAEVVLPAGAGGFTYNDIKTDALIDLKGQSKAAYKDTLVNKIVNDAVQLARKVIAASCPSMIWQSKAIGLVAGNSGPYEISSDFESPVMLLDENNREVDMSYRGEFNVPQRKGKPDGFWIEGHSPANIYVNATPNKAYAWTLYYIATIARVVDFDSYVPLPALCREALAEWVVKWAGQSQEYDTTDEDVKLKMMHGMLSDILRSRRPKIAFSVSGVDF